MWDMVFNDREQEPVGCTPYIILLLIISALVVSLKELPVFIMSYLEYLVTLCIVFTIMLPIVNYMRSKKDEFTFIDFIYVILTFFNVIIGTFLGFSIIHIVISNKDINTTSWIVIFNLVISFFIYKFLQNIIWRVFNTLFKRKEAYNGPKN